MTASNTAFTVFSGISLFLTVIPLWWHLRSWNMQVGTCMFMIWTALACLVHFIDSIVWNGNVINWAPVWCDIGVYIFLHYTLRSHGLCVAIRIIIGVSVALPACGLCISRSLYKITVATTPHGVRFQITLGFAK